MARKQTLEAVLALYKKLGGNLNEVMGTKTNINFLGKGKSPELMLDMDVNTDAIGFLGPTKILEELKSPVGYAVSGKLNDLQANKLLENMSKIDELLNPPQISNITDLRTGTTDLTQEGLGSLRETEKIKRFEAGQKTGNPAMKEVMQEDIRTLQDDLPPPGSRGGPEDIAAPIQSDAATFTGAGLESIKNVKNNNLIVNDIVDKIYLNIGVSANAQPVARANAREFLNRIKDLEDPTFPGGTTLSGVMEADDLKFMTEGGGGGMGDPMLLVQKYFGPKVASSVAQLDNADDIQTFAENLVKIKDAKGNTITSRYFDPESINPDDFEFAEGGSVRPGYMAGNIVRGLYTAAQKTAIFKHLGGEAGSNKNFKNLYKFFKNPDSDPALKDKIDDLLREKGLFRGGGLAKILEV
jgi:hypothetical protein